MRVDFYIARNGTKPVAEYVRSLEPTERQRLADAFFRIQEHGLVGVNWKVVDGRLCEIKVGAHRAFFVLVVGDRMIVLHAYFKKTQKAPQAELDIAQKRAHEVLA